MDNQSIPVEKAIEELSKKLERKQKEIEVFKEVSSGINSSLDLHDTLETWLALLDTYFGFEHSMVLLTTPGDELLTVFASYGYDGSGIGAKVELGKGIIGTVAKGKRLMRFGNVTQRLIYVGAGQKREKGEDPEITIKLPGLSNPRSQVAIPLIIKEELVGVLSVESENFNIFKTEDEKLFSLVGTQAAIAIHNARLFKGERDRFKEVEEINKKLNDLNLEQQKILNLFMKYVPEPIVNKALSDKSNQIFEGEQLKIGLLFCDIRNFTPLSERISPKEVVYVLNSYYTHMSKVIKKYDGVINQFVGDEIFVTFGAPLPISNPAEKAVLCALGMIVSLKRLNKKMKAKFNSEINVGIGINFGSVVAGNLGSEDRIEYSITGDAVNTAKRIESLTRGHPDAILISESIFKKTEHLIETKSWDPINVKGKTKKVQVHQVIGRKN